MATRVVRTDDGCYGVEVDGTLVNDGFDSAAEARDEARRLRRANLVADLRTECEAWVDSFDGDDSADAIRRLSRAIKALSA